MVNIIIPIYKAKETLPAALDSLVAQTKKLFFVTLVQDCDGEDYSEMIENYRKRGLKIKLLSTPYNMGPGGARQVGIDNSKMFEHLMFMDADDMLMPYAVDILTREAKLHDYDIIGSNILQETQDGLFNVMDQQTTSVTWLHGKIYKKAFLDKYNIRFFDWLRLNEDAYFNLVCWNVTNNTARIPLETYIWRYNTNSLTRQGGTNTAFFHKAWVLYIKAQVEGLLALDAINSECTTPELVAATLLNIYGYMMRAIHYNEPDYNEASEYVKKIFHLPLIEKFYMTENFWMYIIHNLQTIGLVEDGIYFYRDRFNDWFNYYFKGEGKIEDLYS